MTFIGCFAAFAVSMTLACALWEKSHRVWAAVVFLVVAYPFFLAAALLIGV